MIRVVHRWRAIIFHSVTWVVLSIEREVVLRFELFSTFVWKQELDYLNLVQFIQDRRPYFMVAQWLHALPNSSFRMEITADEP